MPPSRVRQLLKFLRVFGWSGGLRLWCSLLWQSATHAKELKLQVPGLPGPLHLRPRDLPIFWQIMVMQENDFSSLPQARQVSNAYRNIQADGRTPIIVDCGGHVGLSAVWFASRFPQATVYSIEPDTANFRLLTKNARAFANITPLHGGIWSRPCHLEVLNPDSGSASFRLQEVAATPPAARTALRAYTVDEVLAREENNRLLLVKIDVEGAELEVFRETAPWLDAAAAVVIELHDWLLPGQGTSKNLFKRLGEQDFDVVLRGENLLLFKVPTIENDSSTMPAPAHLQEVLSQR